MSNSPKILIVDDEENIITTISFLLIKEGYITETANNGQNAIEKFQSFAPDVVLLDVMMPIMDGIEAAKEIRRLDTQSKTSIIFLTAKGTPKDKLSGYTSGGDEYVVKPFENEYLLELIAEKVK